MVDYSAADAVFSKYDTSDNPTPPPSPPIATATPAGASTDDPFAKYGDLGTPATPLTASHLLRAGASGAIAGPLSLGTFLYNLPTHAARESNYDFGSNIPSYQDASPYSILPQLTPPSNWAERYTAAGLGGGATGGLVGSAFGGVGAAPGAFGGAVLGVGLQGAHDLYNYFVPTDSKYSAENHPLLSDIADIGLGGGAAKTAHGVLPASPKTKFANELGPRLRIEDQRPQNPTETQAVEPPTKLPYSAGDRFRTLGQYLMTDVGAGIGGYMGEHLLSSHDALTADPLGGLAGLGGAALAHNLLTKYNEMNTANKAAQFATYNEMVDDAMAKNAFTPEGGQARERAIAMVKSMQAYTDSVRRGGSYGSIGAAATTEPFLYPPPDANRPRRGIALSEGRSFFGN